MSVEILAVIIFGLFFILLGIGFPAAFSMFFAGIAGFLAWRGPAGLLAVAANTFSPATAEIYIAIPMFVFMGQVFESSGIGQDMFDAIYKWFGGVRGGLGIAVIVIGALLSCVTGLVSTATVMMGLIGYPEMIKRGYDKRLAIGSVMASGILGPIIPPSVPMVIMGAMTEVSIGGLFIASVIPGVLCTLFFIVYILIICLRNPGLAPALPVEERVNLKGKIISSRGLILPTILSIVVLGGLFIGAFTATEAGSIGASGSLVCAAVRRELNLKTLQKSVSTSLAPFGMVMWILMGGTLFGTAVAASGVGDYLGQFIVGLNLPPSLLVIAILVFVFIEGLALDIIPIAFSNLPIFMPIIIKMGIDPLWFIFLFTMVCIIGVMTPPFGGSLFYFLGLNFKEVTTKDVFIASVPWTLMLCIEVAINVAIPGTVTWLPNLIK